MQGEQRAGAGDGGAEEAGDDGRGMGPHIHDRGRDDLQEACERLSGRAQKHNTTRAAAAAAAWRR